MDYNAGSLLVTGGAGFIGSNFINHYFPTMTFKTLINLDAMYYCARENNIDEDIQNNLKYVFIKGNIRDKHLVTDLLEKYGITHIIHFAAQSHVQNSFEDSVNFTSDNICGTHNLLECCRKYGNIVKFVHVSTDEVYGESMNSVDELKKTEHSILCPTNPYAATKAAAELLAQSYYHSYKFPIIITRGNNVYGPNQYPEKLIPLFIKLLSDGKKVTIQGDGSALRSFLHVHDTVTAFGLILESGVIGEIYNIGCDSGMEFSVLHIAKLIIKGVTGTDNVDDHIEYIADRPFNDRRYYISNDKLKSLGWKITVDFMTGLHRLINATKNQDHQQSLLSSKKMLVLIYGSKGWIAGQFIEILESANVKYVCGKSRCNNVETLLGEIKQVCPTHVISFIGRTHGPGYSTIDYLEQSGKLYENLRDNLYSPLMLADICYKENIHYTYLGTGCIFSNENEVKPTGFTEADTPNFFGSAYSTVKGFTDQLMSRQSALNLRIRMPISHEDHPRNFITKITNYERICSIENSMTVLPEVLPLVLDMMYCGMIGTINLTNPGTISHNTILSMYKEHIDPSFTWVNFTIDEQAKILASARSNNSLDTSKLQALYPNVKNIQDAVLSCLQGWKLTKRVG